MKTILACVVTALVVAAGSATAATLIHGSQIAQGTITNGNVKKGTLTSNRFSPGTQRLLKSKAAPGATGAKGATGATGAAGPKGDTGATGATGPKGDAGTPGAKGDTGDAGTPGTPGAKGDTGNAGTPGTPGAKGDTGNAGTPGTPGTPGAKGDKGDTGDPGTPGAKGDKGDTGDAGTPGAKGDKGDTGAPGANPGVPVLASGDQGWTLSGSPNFGFSGGELRLGGGFDANTVAGGIGIAKAYANHPLLNTLTALSYAYHIDKRPTTGAGSGDAPTIHVAIGGASGPGGTGTVAFTNLVYNPVYNQNAVEAYNVDAVVGQWWSTRAINGLGGSSDQSPGKTLTQIEGLNPNAYILAISVDNGGSSSGTTPVDAFSAGVDNVLVGFDSTFTRYDMGG